MHPSSEPPWKAASETSDPNRVTWDATGTLTGNDVCGASGVWRAYDDCEVASAAGLPCTDWDPALTGPDGQPGFAVSESSVCARGVAPQVIDRLDGEPAYSEMWGAMLALDFAHANGDEPFDAVACAVDGFRFDLLAIGGPGDLMVRLRTAADPTARRFVTIPLPATGARLTFDALDDGEDNLGPPVAPEAVRSLLFHVSTNATAPKPFDFCISNLGLLVHGTAI